MAGSVYVQRTKQIMRGYGLGEKPPLVQAAASANVAVTGGIVTFDMAAGEGAKIAAGDVIAMCHTAAVAQAYVFYVLGVATDTITAVNGYQGAPDIANASSDLDSGVLEILGDGSPSDFEVHNAIDVVFQKLLYPHLYAYDTGTFTPNVSTQRAEVPVDVEEIDDMWQIIGTQLIPIPHKLYKNQETTVSSTGTFVVTDTPNGSTVYYNYRRRLADGDTAQQSSLPELVGLGAAAIAAGWTRPETILASARQDSQNRGQGPDIGATLWRDFLALREEWADDLARTGARRIIVDRG